jgi:hypothetical protein
MRAETPHDTLHCRARASNSGCIVHQTLPGSELLMRGHEPHDEIFSRICADNGRSVAILWPGDDAMNLQDLQEVANRETEGRVTLVAVDATWNGARAVMGSYPSTLRRVHLQAGEIFAPEQERSIMAPLRKYSPVSAKFNNRCALSRSAHACHVHDLRNAWPQSSSRRKVLAMSLCLHLSMSDRHFWDRGLSLMSH